MKATETKTEAFEANGAARMRGEGASKMRKLILFLSVVLVGLALARNLEYELDRDAANAAAAAAAVQEAPAARGAAVALTPRTEAGRLALSFPTPGSPPTRSELSGAFSGLDWSEQLVCRAHVY